MEISPKDRQIEALLALQIAKSAEFKRHLISLIDLVTAKIKLTNTIGGYESVESKETV